MPAEQFVHQPAPAAQLGRGQPGDQRLGQQLRFQAVQVGADHRAQVVAEPRAGQHGGDGRGPGAGVLQHLLEQLGEIQHLHPVVPEYLAEPVVLLLGPVHPGQPVEEHAVPAVPGYPPQLRSRPVQQDGPEPADFAVRAKAVRHDSPCCRTVPPAHG